MKKHIQYLALITFIATVAISCSSDASQGMLRNIANSQEEVSYTIKNSSYNEGDGTFISVESDGIWRASYTDADDDADTNILDNVKREKFEYSADITSIQDIYTIGDNSFILTTDLDGTTDTEITTSSSLQYFLNSEENLGSDFIDVTTTSPIINGEILQLTENGYIISVDSDTSILYIYKISGTGDTTSFDLKGQVDDIDSTDYDSTRYNNYALVKNNSGDDAIDAIIISLTDDDDDTSEVYSADDSYYYINLDDDDTTNYKFTITDDDDDYINEPIVAASIVSDDELIILTHDGDCYQGDIPTVDNETIISKQLWNNDDNSDTFAYHLPTLTYEATDGTGYLMAMDSYDYIYLYYTDLDEDDSFDDRISTVSENTVAYASSLNNASDIIYIQLIDTLSNIDEYRVATKDNGYYTIYIDNTAVEDEDATGHATYDGFK